MGPICEPKLLLNFVSRSYFVSGTRRDFHSGKKGQDARKHVMSILKKQAVINDFAIDMKKKKVKIVSIQ